MKWNTQARSGECENARKEAFIVCNINLWFLCGCQFNITWTPNRVLLAGFERWRINIRIGEGVTRTWRSQHTQYKYLKMTLMMMRLLNPAPRNVCYDSFLPSSSPAISAVLWMKSLNFHLSFARFFPPCLGITSPHTYGTGTPPHHPQSFAQSQPERVRVCHIIIIIRWAHHYCRKHSPAYNMVDSITRTNTRD